MLYGNHFFPAKTAPQLNQRQPQHTNHLLIIFLLLAVSFFCCGPILAITLDDAYIEGYATGYADGYSSGWKTGLKLEKAAILSHGDKLKPEKVKALKEECTDQNRQDYEIGVMTMRGALEKQSYTQEETTAELKGYAASFLQGAVAGMKEAGEVVELVRQGLTTGADQYKEALSRSIKVVVFKEANRLAVSPSMALSIVESQINRVK